MALITREQDKIDNRDAVASSNLSVEISCADVAVAWSLPPACNEK